MFIIANNILEHSPARVATTYYTGKDFSTKIKDAFLIEDKILANLLLHKFNCIKDGWNHIIITETNND